MSDPSSRDSSRLRRVAVQKIEDLLAAGVTDLPRPDRIEIDQPEQPAASAARPLAGCQEHDGRNRLRPAAPSEDRGAMVSPRTPAGSDDPRVAALAEVARRVAACTRCDELVANRTQTVFGAGNPYSRLVFLGEAPGAEEDRQGEPFVGRAGQLLTDIITKGMGLRREDVYILNILKCRPPGNRTPLPAEAVACREYLDGQLEIIRPGFICCLGAVAGQCLLDTKTPIGRLRGRVFDYEGARVVCTFHPAYLLRNPAAKRETWQDIQLLMKEMGLPIPRRQ